MNRRLALSTLAVLLLSSALHAQLIVDCSGANPNLYPSINAALPDAGPGSTIIVTGTCNENVNLTGFSNLNLGAWFGQTATINGWVLLDHSIGIYLYGLNITNANPGGDGIILSFAKNIVVDTCNSSGNGGNGLSVAHASDVVVAATGTFNNNGGGISSQSGSVVLLGAWAGPIDISNNAGPGIASSSSMVGTLGQTTIMNNGSNGGGAGVVLEGGSRAQWGAYLGPNTIQGNGEGGVLLGENSEASFASFGGGPPNLIHGNGPFGVSVGTGSQVTFYETVQITGHTGPGVDVYSNSQAYFFGGNAVLRNGTPSDQQSAGIRLDGNSEVLLRGGTVSHNKGPGILALVNSSVDFTGVTFSGDTGGIITCDSSATMVSDLAKPTETPHGVACRTPHALGNRRVWKSPPHLPDVSTYKAMQTRYRKIATKH